MKNIQPFFVLLAVLGLFLLIGIFCYTQLEIVPGIRKESPSREVRANPYYALEKWLLELKYPARYLTIGNIDTILKGPEKTIFLENSRFTWNKDTEVLVPWIKEGGRLIISLDSYISRQLNDFMKSLGVKASSFYDDDDDETEETEVPETAEHETNETEKENPASLDWDISFKIEDVKPPVDRVLVINDYGKTRLVKLEIGKGSLVLTGKAYFLHNNNLHYKEDNLYLEGYYLDRKENRNLAGELFFPAGEQGILLIRSPGGDRQILGNLFDRGNPAALLISVLLLIIAGFWMVIPSFGRYKPMPEKPGKPLRERFLAEGRFLKKNKALGKYIETYKKELEQKSRNRGITGAVQSMAASMERSPEESLGESIKAIGFAQFIKDQKILIEQLKKLNRENP